jgi:protein required for attachment to host cells
MNTTCIVVADGGRARFFGVEPVESPRAKTRLVERAVLDNPDLRTREKSATGREHTETHTNRDAGPVHPVGAQRERHRLELERRFGHEIALKAAEIANRWDAGTVVLIADPRLLGLMREYMRDALKPAIELKELAKDFTKLTPEELHDHLARNSIVPARRQTVT